MRLTPDCVRCLTCLRLGEVLRFVGCEERAFKAQCRILELVRDATLRGEDVTVAATETFRVVKEFSGLSDPYKEEKRLSNAVATKVLREFVEPVLAKVSDPRTRFRLAVAAAINFNRIDFGVFGYSPSVDAATVLSTEFAIDHVDKVFNALSNARKVAYLLDNCGEVVADMQLMKVIRELFPKVEIVAVVKGGAFQNDVTVGDAEELALNEVADKVVSTESDAASIIEGYVPNKVVDEVASSDLVLAKGMAHYEYLSTRVFTPTAFLLVAKCGVVAKSLNVRVGSSVAMFTAPKK